MPFKNNIDDALSIIGYGRWQIPVFALTFLIHFLVPIHMMGSALLSVPLPFRCFSSSAAPLEAYSNYSYNSTSLTSQPPAVTYNSKCGVAGQNVSLPASLLRKTDLSSCPYVQYDHSIFPSTVVSEFNLVCERSSLRPLFQVIISLGALFGALLGGVISDKYGRKRIIIGGTVVNMIAVLMTAWCLWYRDVLFSRFLAGLTVGFFVLPSYSLAQETTPPRFRSHSGMLIGLGFSLGIIVVAGEAFLVRHWRHLQLTAASSLIIIIPLACVVEESPRWLSQIGRQQEAADTLKRAARRNGVPVTPEFVGILQKLKEENKNSDDVLIEGHGNEKPSLRLKNLFIKFCSYFRYPGLRRILCVTPFIWYLQTLLYLGILLNANNFTSNNPFMYVALSGVMDLIAICLTTPIAVHVGRRCLSMALYLVSGTLLLLDIAIPAEMKWLKWMFVMFAFLLCAASYQIQFIYTPELYPTVIRSRGFGFVNGMGSIGLLTAPLITDLLVQEVWWSVNVVCGLSGIIACLLVSFLPETRNLPLPKTLQDVEKRFHGNKNFKDSEVTGGLAIHETADQHNMEALLNTQSERNNLKVQED